MPVHSLVIVTPALAAANNGNWQTARRWAQMLRATHRVRIAASWAGGDESLMIALHARRSAASIQAWRQQAGSRPLVLVLTGTDLYRDIQSDALAQASLQAHPCLLAQRRRQRQRAELVEHHQPVGRLQRGLGQGV